MMASILHVAIQYLQYAYLMIKEENIITTGIDQKSHEKKFNEDLNLFSKEGGDRVAKKPFPPAFPL